MKKFMAVLLALCFFGLTLTSCGENGNGDSFFDSITSFIKGPDDIENKDYLDVEKNGFTRTARDSLSDEMQEYYDLLDQYVYKFDDEIDRIKLHKDDFYQLVQHYRSDNPQAFWLTTSYDYHYETNSDLIISAKMSYAYAGGDRESTTAFTSSQIEKMCAEMESAAEEILSGIFEEMDEYDIVLYLHDYLAMNVAYDETADFQHIAYGALVEKKAVCDGYSTAMQYLLNKVGIECRIVYGDDRENNPDSHAWNLVKLDDEYYHLDVTWDLPPVGLDFPIYANFLVDTMQIEKRHVIFSPMEGEEEPAFSEYPVIPKAIISAMGYYHQNDTYVEDLSDASVQQIIRKTNEAIVEKREHIQFYFASRTDLEDFIEELVSGSARLSKTFPYRSQAHTIESSTLEEENILIFCFDYGT